MQNLEDIFLKENTYRLKEAKKVLYRDLISDWQEAKFLPKEIREKLNQTFPISKSYQIKESQDRQTLKALISLTDGKKIETVLMRHQDGRNTVCVSTQVGCAMGCRFCATGKLGFSRNLESMEIVEQVLVIARELKNDKQKVTNVVFMGMGEPFLNYENVITAIKILNDKEGFNLGARHFSISTCGIIEGIKKLGQEELDINLAISFHAPNQDLREKLMPISKKHSLQKLMEAIKEYIEQKNRRVMFEYVMLKNVNDSEKEAKELARLLQGMLCMVNLIRYNETGDFEASDSKQIKVFKQILENRGIEAVQRYHFGSEINAACGQLVASVNNS